MLELAKILIKTIVKKAIDLELFSLRSGYAKRVLIVLISRVNTISVPVPQPQTVRLELET